MWQNVNWWIEVKEIIDIHCTILSNFSNGLVFSKKKKNEEKIGNKYPTTEQSNNQATD